MIAAVLFLLTLAPANAEFAAFVERARAAEKRKAYPDAVAAWDAALQDARLFEDKDRTQRLFSVLRARGLTHEAAGDIPAAAKDFEAALKLVPDHRATLRYWHYLVKRQEDPKARAPRRPKPRFDLPGKDAERREAPAEYAESALSRGEDGSSFPIAEGWTRTAPSHLVRVDLKVLHALRRGPLLFEIAAWDENGKIGPMIEQLRRRDKGWGFQVSEAETKTLANGAELTWVWSLQRAARKQKLHVLEGFIAYAGRVYLFNALAPAKAMSARDFRGRNAGVFQMLDGWRFEEL